MDVSTLHALLLNIRAEQAASRAEQAASAARAQQALADLRSSMEEQISSLTVRVEQLTQQLGASAVEGSEPVPLCDQPDIDEPVLLPAVHATSAPPSQHCPSPPAGMDQENGGQGQGACSCAESAQAQLGADEGPQYALQTSVCLVCRRTCGSPPSACSSCKVVTYCGPPCQDRDWKERKHKTICRVLASPKGRSLWQAWLRSVHAKEAELAELSDRGKTFGTFVQATDNIRALLHAAGLPAPVADPFIRWLIDRAHTVVSRSAPSPTQRAHDEEEQQPVPSTPQAEGPGRSEGEDVATVAAGEESAEPALALLPVHDGSSGGSTAAQVEKEQTEQSCTSPSEHVLALQVLDMARMAASVPTAFAQQVERPKEDLEEITADQAAIRALVKTCVACHTSPHKTFCKRCRITGYCSKECQASDWTATHKRLCASLRDGRVCRAIRDLHAVYAVYSARLKVDASNASVLASRVAAGARAAAELGDAIFLHIIPSFVDADAGACGWNARALQGFLVACHGWNVVRSGNAENIDKFLADHEHRLAQPYSSTVMSTALALQRAAFGPGAQHAADADQ